VILFNERPKHLSITLNCNIIELFGGLGLGLVFFSSIFFCTFFLKIFSRMRLTINRRVFFLVNIEYFLCNSRRMTIELQTDRYGLYANRSRMQSASEEKRQNLSKKKISQNFPFKIHSIFWIHPSPANAQRRLFVAAARTAGRQTHDGVNIFAQKISKDYFSRDFLRQIFLMESIHDFR
jgi:hypothetical protein